MQEIKYCQRCGKQIGNLYESDYYSFIRLKYCSGCKSIVKREQDAKRMKKFREDNRQKNKMIRDELFLQKEKNELLQEENELLRQKINELREVIL